MSGAVLDIAEEERRSRAGSQLSLASSPPDSPRSVGSSPDSPREGSSLTRKKDGAPDQWRTDKPAKDLYQGTGFKAALKRSRESPYILANAVYIIYAALILSIDLHPEWDLTYVNNMFVGAAVVHVINAAMYIWVWLDAGYPLVHRIMIPEILNVLEATFYLASASMYRYEGTSGTGSSSSEILYPSESFNPSTYTFDPILHDVQCIEITASIIEMLAAIGWVTTWYFTYQRVPGRGFTFDDPDTWANFTIIAPAVIYIVYNVQLQIDPSNYGADFLYVIADKIYMANAVCYFLASLRDVGWFWFMPTSGRFPFNWRLIYNYPWSPFHRRRTVPQENSVTNLNASL